MVQGGTGPLAALTPLAVEIGDLKRVRDASSPESLASRLFRRAWAALVAGAAPDRVALCTTADALAACRLGGISRAVLHECGMEGAEGLAVLARSFDEVAAPIGPALRPHLRDHLGQDLPWAEAPAFVDRLVHQPRAGATCPGKPRIVLEPPEGHGDHCLTVAVLGCILSAHYGCDPATPFVAGLAHHLHNAVLPDSGFAGEMLLGDHLEPVMQRLFARELAQLAPGPRGPVQAALATIRDADTPHGRAFHAADVIDRVLQMRHYDRVAAFTVSQALEDMDLVHAGPVQSFHYGVMQDAGLP